MKTPAALVCGSDDVAIATSLWAFDGQDADFDDLVLTVTALPTGN